VFRLNPRIQCLVEVSRRVISDCALENGAIVAANCFKECFPKEAKDYMYVWPRDASFTCVSARDRSKYLCCGLYDGTKERKIACAEVGQVRD
jgi:hypothetical protein